MEAGFEAIKRLTVANRVNFEVEVPATIKVMGHKELPDITSSSSFP